MENPYRYLRREAGLTQESLASLTGLSRNYILSVEAGLYNLPSSRLATTLLSRAFTPLFQDEFELLDGYYDWIKKERAVASSSVAPRVSEYLIHPRSISNTRQHPHVSFRIYVVGSRGAPSQIRYCKLIKVQQSIVQNFESGGKSELPLLIKEALIDCGVSIHDVSRIEHAFRTSSSAVGTPVLPK